MASRGEFPNPALGAGPALCSRDPSDFQECFRRLLYRGLLLFLLRSRERHLAPRMRLRMTKEEPGSKDWRSVSTRSHDKASLELAAARARA